MELIPIKVECHSAFKADEYPKNFVWNNVEFKIVEIIDCWHEAYNISTSQTVDYYKVKTNLAGRYMLKHEIESDKWFLRV